MHTFNPYLYSRRGALKTLWAGFGYTAFAGLIAQAAAKETAAKKGRSTRSRPIFRRAPNTSSSCA